MKVGNIEITDVNLAYLRKGLLQVERLWRGIAWLDTGTPSSLLQASEFIRVLEERQGLKVACLEEIAFRMGYIDAEELGRAADRLQATPYGTYLHGILKDSVAGETKPMVTTGPEPDAS